MSVRGRNLKRGICYIFNGRDFVVNRGLPPEEYGEELASCLENDPDRGGESGSERAPGKERGSKSTVIVQKFLQNGGKQEE